MMASRVLTVEHLSKKFASALRRSLWHGLRDIGRELIPGRHEALPTLRRGEFWALDDVSFTLDRGEALAVVGANGAGKSTLLKVLFALLKPDRGDVRIQGRVEGLIELGTGFNPVLTGRENALIAAAMNGIGARQTRDYLNAVMEFAELGDFFESPVQGYSAGMRARLAYAVAAQMPADLLLVDEVLAVGDMAFQRKCAAHMRGYLNRGGALLLVSHSAHQVQALCGRGLLLDRGRVVFAGTAADALNTMFERRFEQDRASGPASAAPATGAFTVLGMRADAVHDDAIQTGGAVRITMRYRADIAAEIAWGFNIWTADQWVCVAGEIDLRRAVHAGEGTVSCVIPSLPLVSGRYALGGGVLDADSLQPLAQFGWTDVAAPFDVRSRKDLTPAGVLLANTRIAVHQLVTLDVVWE